MTTPLRLVQLSRPEPTLISAAVGSAVMLAPRTPSIIAITSANAPAGGFASISLKAPADLTPASQLQGSLQDTWLYSLYGDKRRLREFIEHKSVAGGLPVDFFLRLLQQESGLDHRAVRHAGAHGIAQFVLATEAERDLLDPFEAIPKAAQFSQKQRRTRGRLHLAAAAYKAGPQRVRNWIAGRATLPQETRAYVSKITGRSAD
jgi:soluble lytic murein transglycosylase-like protein